MLFTHLFELFTHSILTHHYCPEQIIYFQVTPKPTVVRVMPLTTSDNAFSWVAGELLHCDVKHDKIQSASTRTFRIKKSCISKSSPHMAASSYCHLFKSTFQRLQSSTGATAAYPWNTSMPILHGKTEQLTQWRVQHNSKQHCCHNLPTEHRQAILIKDTSMW